MVKFVTFGETMVQYNARYVGPYREGGEYLEDCAGAESNVAVDLSKLGIPDVETTWVSRLGDDEAGSLILRACEEIGLILYRDDAGWRTMWAKPVSGGSRERRDAV